MPVADGARHALHGRDDVRAQPRPLTRIEQAEQGAGLRNQAFQICRAGGADESVDFRASSLNILIHMVVGSLGITLFPVFSLAVEPRRIRHLSLRPFQKPEPGRTIGLVWRRTSPRQEEFHLLGELLTQAYPLQR